MPKPSRGGKRSAPQSAFTLQNQGGTATPQQAQDILNDLNNNGIVAYSNYMKLSDDEKADAMNQMLKNDLPNFLDDSATQRLQYYADVDGLPTIVSDSALDKMSGMNLFRTVRDEYDSRSDVAYSAKQIYNQIAKGIYTRVSGKGGSAHGKGLYFADSYGASTIYGSGNANKDLTMRAKYNSNARPISETRARNGLRNAMASGSKIGQEYSKIYNSRGSQDAISVWAINNGYNVIDAGSYQVVLDRRALSISSRTTDAGGSSWHTARTK